MEGLNPNASGFVPFGAPAASGSSSAAPAPQVKAKMPEKPPANASPEELTAWKMAVQKYLEEVKAEKARLALENEKKQEQQQQKQQHSFVVETVYADEVGYGDDDEDDDDEYFANFGANQEGDDDDEEDDLKPVAEGKEGPASKSYEGKDLDADELFRLAKNPARDRPEAEVTADFLGIEAELVARTGFDLCSHRDSFNRGALHFAAEGGNASLIEELKKKLGEGALGANDDKGMLPWQMAVLAGHGSEVSKLLIPRSGVQGVNSVQDLDSPALLASLMQRFAPKSASAALAFGAKPPEFPDQHKVWGKDAAAAEAAVAGGVRTMSIQCSTLNMQELASLEAFDAICNSFGNPNRQAGGLSPAVWSAPRPAVDFGSRQQYTHLVAGFNDKTADGAFVGAIVFSAIGALAGRGVSQQLVGNDAYCVTHAAVSPAAPHDTLRALMVQAHKDYQGSTVFLRTAAKLPVSPANPVAQCKWMYRIVRPWNVFVDREAEKRLAAAGNHNKQPSSSSSLFCPLRGILAADYFKFSSTSIVDTVVRQGVSENFPVVKGELAQWEALRPGTVSETDAEGIAQVASGTVNAEAVVGVHWNGMMVKAFSESADLRFCVRRGGANGAVSDIILLKLITPLGAEESGTMTAAVLSGMYCPTVAKGRRAVVASAVAAMHCSADVLFTSNTFGLSNADLVNCFFTDLPGSIEKIYCLAGVDKTLAGVNACQTASQCYVPFF